MTDLHTITSGARIEAVDIKGLGAVLEAQSRNSGQETSFSATALARFNAQTTERGV